MTQVNERAMVIAKILNREGCADCSHIYEDGLIMQVECEQERHEAISKALRKECGITEEAREGNMSVWILPFVVKAENAFLTASEISKDTILT